MNSIRAIVIASLPAILVTCIAHAGAPEGPAVGEPAPPLSISEYVQAPENADASWEMLQGNVVIVEFWATWCGPCIAAIPHLNELTEHFKDEPVQFIAISNETPEPVERFLERREMKAWVVLDDDNTTWREYGIVGIPRTFIVDADGRIIADTHPNVLERDHIEQVLAGETPSLPERSAGQTVTAGLDPDEASAEPPLFQVMIRQAEERGGTSAMGPDAVTMIGTTPQSIIRYAYGVPPTRTDIVADLDDAFYTLVARVPRHRADELRSLVRNAVEVTFDIIAERETRRVPILELTLPDHGEHALEPSVQGTGRSMHSGGGTFTMTNSPIASLVSRLENIIGVPVNDETDLEGGFDINFSYDHQLSQWSKEKRIAEMVNAVHEQLGLELHETERDIEFLVIRSKVETAQAE